MKKLIIFSFIIQVIATNLNADQLDQGFADNLMQDNDYFRAISVYKYIEFKTKDDSVRSLCRLKIAKAYFKSNKYKSAIQYFARALNDTSENATVKKKAFMGLGLSYYELKILPLAETYFQNINDTIGYTDYFSALIDLDLGNWESAYNKYKSLALNNQDTLLSNSASRLMPLAQDGYKIQSKSPFLASALSTFVPGSGQFYCKHYYDALQAFLYVSSFAYASFLAYRYDANNNTGYTSTYLSVSVTAMFHFGNIIGASRTAKYNNYRSKELFMTKFREEALNIGL